MGRESLVVGASNDEEIDSSAMVLGVNPIAHVPAIAVERKWFVFERVGNEKRDEFF